MSAGRRPYRSEKRPQIGALSRLAIEKEDIKTPTTQPLPPSSTV
jgi:hypothetical protein